MIARDGANTSLWQEVKSFPAGEQVNMDRVFDVLVIGGGITGLSTALALQKKGKKCVLAEAWTLGFGTTSGTTAHLNNFFDEPYYKVSKHFGEDNAKLLAKGALDAMAMIRSNIEEYAIDCAYSSRQGLLFATDEEQVAELERVVAGTQKAGINIEYINESPFPIPYLRIAQLPDQAQFHPVQYLHGLARAFESLGGVILEQYKVDKLEHGDDLVIAHSDAGLLKAHYAVYATHTAPGVNMIHFRCAPYRSYVLAFKLRNDNYPEALGYDLADPYHYYRTQQINGESYLIAGGEDHKTGHEENTELPFRKLESYARKYFDIETVTHRWSSQYYESVDGLPFIGHLPGNPANVFVAAAFGGNGMIYGSIAAKIFTDLITEGSSEYSSLFNPARIKPAAGFHNFIKENADVVKEFITGKFSSEKINELASVAPGEGKLVKYESTSIALFKDELHKLHAVNPTCTHVHCTVGWNQAERSWDCPCHGARFSIDGKVLNGPAGKDLATIMLSGTE
jgi:glycine/D-amino acid oxidase-like deaminating enzyme/nitrite reductase/ring-hydroxylating ferredoxin subunit